MKGKKSHACSVTPIEVDRTSTNTVTTASKTIFFLTGGNWQK